MAEDNLAQEVEFYDEAETIKASSTMNEQEVENLSGSNVNDNTPKETQLIPRMLQIRSKGSSLKNKSFLQKIICQSVLRIYRWMRFLKNASLHLKNWKN